MPHKPALLAQFRQPTSPLGVLMLDTQFPRLLGDVGNALTWPFPVVYKVVRGARPDRVVQLAPDADVLDPFLSAARRLERDGARAITTSCGFLAAYQPELAAAVHVPVFTSALLQVPLAVRMIAAGEVVAILTVREMLTERHFNGVGWSANDMPVAQLAPPPDSHFVRTFFGNTPTADIDQLRREVEQLTERAVREYPVGAIVLECANLSPFAGLVRRIANVPVFDLYTLGITAHLSTAIEIELPAPKRRRSDPAKVSG